MIGWMFFLYQQLDIDASDDVHNSTKIKANRIFGAIAITTIISTIIYSEFQMQTMDEYISNDRFFIFSSRNTTIGWYFSNFAGYLLDTGACIQYATTNGSITNMVLVGRHRIVGSIIFPSILFDRITGGVASLRIHHSEREKGKTSGIFQLGIELCSVGRVSVTANGRQRFK